jgi:P27 family predicted phage terminase small subunit
VPGRPRKPDHLKVLHGDREDRINRDAPVPHLTTIEPPIDLSDRAMTFWNRLAPDMKNQGILTDWDLDALAQACDCLAMYWEFRELLENHKNDSEFGPYVAKGAAGGVIKHPYFQCMRDAQAMALQIFSRFGMTPADRSKLTTKKEDGTMTGLDELIS